MLNAWRRSAPVCRFAGPRLLLALAVTVAVAGLALAGGRQAAAQAYGTASAAAPPTVMPNATPAASPASEGQSGLLPKYRILSYYGFPGNELMGILGEYDKDTLLAKLQDQATAYDQADPSHPVMPAFEVIASVAQADAGSDGLYLSHTDPNILDEYADYTAQHGIQLFLDVQFGRDTIQREIDAVRPWLQRPNVHLALDPEFHVGPGEQPGQDLGSIDASWITYAQQQLAQISQENKLPPKILIVHQFRISMIQNRDQLKPVPGVQLVLNADGFGDPGLKVQVYNQLADVSAVQYSGIKLFYKQDDPLMTPEQVLALQPVPDVVIYQ